MRRLIWGFVGRTYHMVGNLMHWLNLYDDVNFSYDNEGFYLENMSRYIFKHLFSYFYHIIAYSPQTMQTNEQ